MKVSPETVEKMIENFDFKKVRKAMKALDWKYVGESDSPSVQSMKKSVRELVEKVLSDDKILFMGSGGFIVRQDGDDISIAFEIDSVESENFIEDSEAFSSSELQ